jgi:hypothetical protein
MFRTSVKSKTTVTLGTMAVAALVLLFASGHIVENQKAFAANMVDEGD